MLKKLKKLLIVFLVMTLTLIQLSNLIYAINDEINTTAWNVTPDSTVELGLSFKQTDNKYYKIQYTPNGGSTTKSRAVYRAYNIESGSTKDFSKNIFCLDIDGTFPNETSTGNVAQEGGSAKYKSKGDVNVRSTNIDISNSKKLNADQILKVLAILNKGYDYNTFEKNGTSGLASWLDEVFKDYEVADDTPTGEEMLQQGTVTAAKVFLLEQVAIWEVTNNFKLSNNLFYTTTTPNSLDAGSSWNTESDEPKKNAETHILNYFRKIVTSYYQYLPKNTDTPAFDKNKEKTVTYNGTYAYIGPFNLKNSSNITEAKVYGIDKNNSETQITSFIVTKTNSGTQVSSGIKGTNGEDFYIRVLKSTATKYEKIKIKTKSKLRKMTLWESSNSSASAQKLISVSEEQLEDNDEATIEKLKYDVALRKFITKINGVDITTSGLDSREPEPERSKGTEEFNKYDFQYKHKKDPVKVHIGDKVTYTIRLYNECENNLQISGIKDYLPQGLELDKTAGNSNDNWTASESNTAGEKYASYNGGDISIAGITSSSEKPQQKDIEITCIVKEDVTANKILTNVAEIVQVKDMDGHIQVMGDNEDDSTGGNLGNGKKCEDNYKGTSKKDVLTDSNFYYYGEEDDDDFEKLIVEVEGKYKIDLEKVDENEKTITDNEAQFKITEQNKTGETKDTVNGKVTLVDNKEISSTSNQDEYTVEEISAPDGYNKTTEKLNLRVFKKQQGSAYVIEKVEVRINGSESTVKTVTTSSEQTVGAYKISLTNNTILIKAKNTKIDGNYRLELIKTDENSSEITSGVAKFNVNNSQKTTTNGRLVIEENKKIENLETPDEYTIEEIEAPTGYQKTDKKLKIKVSKKQAQNILSIDHIDASLIESDGTESQEKVTVTGSGTQNIGDFEIAITGTVITVKVKNKKIEGAYNLNLRKTDDSGSTISTSEATFNIDGNAKTTEKGILKIAENKKIDNTANADEYTIEEVKAPKGYKLFNKKLKLKVNKIQNNEKYEVKSVDISFEDGDTINIPNGQGNQLDLYKVSLKDNVITVILVNEEIEGEYSLNLQKVDDSGKTISTSEATFNIDGSAKTTENGILKIAENKKIDNTETADEYTIEEVNPPKGYKLFNKKLKVKVNKTLNNEKYEVESVDISFEDGDTINITNGKGDQLDLYKVSLKDNVITVLLVNEEIKGKYNINLEKVDENGDLITSGEATFKVNEQNENSTTGGKLEIAKDIEITNTNSKDQYIIEETKAPEGYEKIDDKLILMIAKAEQDGAYKLSNVQLSIEGKEGSTTINVGEKGSLGSYEVTLTDELITIKAKNKKIDEKKIFDLALKKFITKVKTPNGDGTYEEKDYNNRCRPADGTPLNTSNDAKYDLDKDVIRVKTGDTVIYTIRVFNEGDIDGTATVIADDLPEGLEFIPYSVDDNENFVSGSELNYKYKWKPITESENEHWKTGIYTEYLNNKTIKAYDKGTNTLSYEDVQVELRVVGTKPEVIKNIAEILEDTDEDRDSIPKDEVETEDDEDYDNIIPEEEPGKFDLSLQKFITKIDEKEITERTPTVTYEDGKIKFAHPQDAVVVVNGNKVTYTIRLYNEGDIAGFPSMVKDDLPDGIKFLEDSDTNKKYEWKMYKESENGTISFGEKKYEEVSKVEDADIIATDYYSYEKAKARGEEAIKPFDANAQISNTNPDYRDLKVEFEVVAKGVSAKDKIIINTAEIAEDEDEEGNPIEDIDSTPNNDKDEEDDIDKERLQLKYFDLSLLKYVSEVEVTEDGKKKTIKTGYDGTENPEPIVKIEINRKKLNKTEVKYTFTIKITNEGEIEGYATEITDYIPSGLEFFEKDNTKYKWKLKDGSKNTVTTDYLKDTLLKPGESATIKIVLRWKKSEKNLGQKINTAEISEDKNEYNTPDIDSTPDNKKDGEDDIDDAPVILSISTGGTQLYIILTITVFTILSIGGYLIYKYVYCYQEEKMYINNIYKKYNRKF